MNHQSVKSRLISLNTTAKNIFLCMIFVVLAVTPKVLESSQAVSVERATPNRMTVNHFMVETPQADPGSIDLEKRDGPLALSVKDERGFALLQETQPGALEFSIFERQNPDSEISLVVEP